VKIEMNASVVEEGVLAIMTDLFYHYFPDKENPFNNTGASCYTPRFIIKAYRWSEGDPSPNLEWRDFGVTWYKYAGRVACVNRFLAPKEALEMLNEFKEDLEYLKESRIDPQA